MWVAPCSIMDKTEVRTPRTAPISCPFESAVEGTAKKWRNNSYVPSIKCTVSDQILGERCYKIGQAIWEIIPELRFFRVRLARTLQRVHIAFGSANVACPK